MAPVGRGYCRLESLLDGTLTLYDLAIANDHISVTAENQRRMTGKH
jgi:hypothetical protein